MSLLACLDELSATTAHSTLTGGDGARVDLFAVPLRAHFHRSLQGEGAIEALSMTYN
jgi:hypothetical protein